MSYPNATHLAPNLKRSEAYCRCGCTPPAHIVANMILYAKVWQKIRTAYGKPVLVNCLYRCPKHNATLPGAAKASYHLQAQASDNTPGDGSMAELIAFAKAALTVPEIRGISIYEAVHGGFVHIDTRPGPKWFGVNGITNEPRFRRILAAGRFVA